MSAGERVFSVVRGRLYERLPTLALPLGKISCCEAGQTDRRRSLPPAFWNGNF